RSGQDAGFRALQAHGLESGEQGRERRWRDLVLRRGSHCSAARPSGFAHAATQGGVDRRRARGAHGRRPAINRRQVPGRSPWAGARLGQGRAAVVRSARMSKWRTIDSAPMNENVIGFFPDFAETDQILICRKLEFDGDPDPPNWWERTNPLIAEPTHWMPIPKPPGRC